MHVFKGAIQLLRSHLGEEGGFLKMRTKANGGEGGGGSFLVERSRSQRKFFLLTS